MPQAQRSKGAAGWQQPAAVALNGEPMEGQGGGGSNQVGDTSRSHSRSHGSMERGHSRERQLAAALQAQTEVDGPAVGSEQQLASALACANILRHQLTAVQQARSEAESRADAAEQQMAGQQASASTLLQQLTAVRQARSEAETRAATAAELEAAACDAVDSMRQRLAAALHDLQAAQQACSEA
jgi:chromosome segregation ATPase